MTTQTDLFSHFEDLPREQGRLARTISYLITAIALAFLLLPVSAAFAHNSANNFSASDWSVLEAKTDWQCVPYARKISGISIYGDAHTWWGKADGRYARGNAPMVGAVMALRPHGKMQLGHVAMVSKILDNRNILLNHANWSQINGSRGQVERDVLARDVSKNNDWSEVKIWYTPIGHLGKTRYPLYGFIYPMTPAEITPGQITQGKNPASVIAQNNIAQNNAQAAQYPASDDPIAELLEDLQL